MDIAKIHGGGNAWWKKVSWVKLCFDYFWENRRIFSPLLERNGKGDFLMQLMNRPRSNSMCLLADIGFVNLKQPLGVSAWERKVVAGLNWWEWNKVKTESCVVDETEASWSVQSCVRGLNAAFLAMLSVYRNAFASIISPCVFVYKANITSGADNVWTGRTQNVSSSYQRRQDKPTL